VSITAATLQTAPGAPLSSTAFSWVKLDVAGNDWGLLAPGTRYWVGLVPGASGCPTPRGGRRNRYDSGVVFGGIADPAATALLPQVRLGASGPGSLALCFTSTTRAHDSLLRAPDPGSY
jgi:hypothetical protein